MNKRPQQSGNGMFVQVQTSVEIQSSVSISYRCSEKEYERLFIREPEVKARAGKMAYVRPEYHERIMRSPPAASQSTRNPLPFFHKDDEGTENTLRENQDP